MRRFLLFFITIILSFLLTYSGPGRFLELKLIDSRFRVRGEESPPDNIVIISIDDDTYSFLGLRFPYPRSIYAKLLKNLKRAGAASVGLDIEFDVPGSNPKNDTVFAEAIRNFGNVVLATKLKGDGVIEPIPLLKRYAKMGFANVPPDRDGTVRKYLFKSKTGRKSFALSLSNVKNFNRYRDYLCYYGPSGTFKTIPMWMVLDDEQFFIPGVEDSANDVNAFNSLLQEGVFRGKTVLVGVTLSELHDFYNTPFNEKNGKYKETSGVEIHATALGNIIQGKRIIRIPEWWIWIGISLIVILLLFLPFEKIYWMLSLFLFLMSVIVVLDYYLFVKELLLIPLTPVITSILITYLSGTTESIMRSQREKRLVRNIFQKFVPGVIMDQILKNPDSINLGGEKKTLTVMFTDIEGFTSFSEGKDPSVVVNLINKYLGEMTEVIFKHRGTVDKYEGDAIMAIFGAPYYFDEHPMEAVLSALEMNKKLRKLWEEGFPKLKTRFGINTGIMIVGNMGTEERMDYTVIGDSVNLASRLEGANKIYGTDILVGENTYRNIGDRLPFREIDTIRVKGKKEPVRIYQPLGFEWSDGLREFVEKFHRALEFYKGMMWDQAERVFKEIYKEYLDRASMVFLERIRIFRASPPPEDWDGVFTMKIK